MITPFGELPNRWAAGLSLADQSDFLSQPRFRVQRLRFDRIMRSAGGGSPGLALIGRQIAYGADPARSMTVAFALTGASSAEVRVRRAGGTDEHTIAADIQSVTGSATRYARATVVGLMPDTEYEYTVVGDGKDMTDASFRTAAVGAHEFRFTAFGDQNATPAAVSMINLVAGLQPRLHLFAGDLSYADRSGLGGVGDIFEPKRWDDWIAQNDPFAARVPMMCAPGNHEMEPGFALHGYAGLLARVPIGGSVPLTVPVASTFVVGSVGFVGLDTNDVSYEIPANRGWTGNAQTTWLEGTLTALRADDSKVDFIVIFLHASPYTSNTAHASEGGVRESWVPLFDKYEVDLVISGHNHCYERTLPIRKGKSVELSPTYVDGTLGTTYITAGGGGAEITNYNFLNGSTARVRDADGYHKEDVSWIIPSDRENSYNVIVVDVQPAARIRDETRLSIRALNEQGQQLDSWIIYRPARSGAVAIDESAPVWPWVGGVAVATLGAVGGGLLWRARRMDAVKAASAPSGAAGDNDGLDQAVR